MSWNGIHPTVSKARAREVLPPAPCKRTVYFVRCLPSMPRGAREDRAPTTCSRCGVTYVPSEVLNHLSDPTSNAS